MNIWTFDLATECGVAKGPPPESLDMLHSRGLNLRMAKDEGLHDLSFNFLAYLNDSLKLDARPDMIVCEKPMSPNIRFKAEDGREVRQNDVSLLLPHLLFDRLYSLSRARGIRLETVSPATYRKVFLGKVSAGNRKDTKALMVETAIQWGYVPGTSKNDNRADAVGMWHWAQIHFARWQPPYELIGGRRVPLIRQGAML